MNSQNFQPRGAVRPPSCKQNNETTSTNLELLDPNQSEDAPARLIE